MKPIDRAVEILGLKRIGMLFTPPITPQAVFKWTQDGVMVPAERCVAIELATDGAVTRYDLRPDVFGPSPQNDCPQPNPMKEAA